MNLSKADTCLKRTHYLVPQVDALKRFYCISFLLLIHSMIATGTICFICFLIGFGSFTETFRNQNSFFNLQIVVNFGYNMLLKITQSIRFYWALRSSSILICVYIHIILTNCQWNCDHFRRLR